MKCKEGFMLREIGEEAVIVPIGQRVIDFNALVSLNATGAYLWNLLANGITEEALVTAVVTEFEVDEEQARLDVTSYIADLSRLGLIS